MTGFFRILIRGGRHSNLGITDYESTSEMTAASATFWPRSPNRSPGPELCGRSTAAMSRVSPGLPGREKSAVPAPRNCRQAEFAKRDSALLDDSSLAAKFATTGELC